MRDLSATSGLRLLLDERTGLLHAAGDLVLGEPAVRRLGELREVLADPATATPPDRPCYFLYRDVRRPGDEERLAAHGLRYDLTVTLPGRYGQEPAKTAGHYHSRAPDGAGYPEIYEVLHGRAAFLLQWVDRPESPDPAVRAIWVALCDAGERIVIPPDCGHVTVNVGAEPLVVADLVAVDSANDYGSFRTAQGAAAYLLADQADELGFRITPNLRYGRTPAPRLLHGSRWRPVLTTGRPLYEAFRSDPSTVRFLLAPGPASAALHALWTE